MITLPSQITESFVPITAGIIVSLINKYFINSACCEAYTPQEVDSDSESDETKMTDSVSRTSAITSASLPSHPIHASHHFYVHNSEGFDLKEKRLCIINNDTRNK